MICFVSISELVKNTNFNLLNVILKLIDFNLCLFNVFLELYLLWAIQNLMVLIHLFKFDMNPI